MFVSFTKGSAKQQINLQANSISKRNLKANRILQTLHILGRIENRLFSPLLDFKIVSQKCFHKDENICVFFDSVD